jgi:hypothetical protein
MGPRLRNGAEAVVRTVAGRRYLERIRFGPNRILAIRRLPSLEAAKLRFGHECDDGHLQELGVPLEGLDRSGPLGEGRLRGIGIADEERSSGQSEVFFVIYCESKCGCDRR